MNKLLTFTIHCSLFIVLALNLASIAHAASAGLAISPPVVEVILAPQKKVIHAFELTNRGASGDFVANLHQVIPTDSMGHVTVDPNPLNPTTIPLILSLANADRELGQPFTLKAGDSTQLVLAIESNSTDTSKDYYFALVISPLTPTPSLSQSATVPGIAALVFATLTPDGNLPIKLELKDFELPILHDSMTPLTLTPTLENSAEIMLRPGGELTITSPRNNHSDSIKLYPSLVLSHSSRTLQAWENPPDSAPNSATNDTPSSATALIYRPHWYNFGPYRLTLTITSPGNTQIMSIEKVVWLLPIRALLGLTLLALITTSLLISAKKRAKPTPQL